MPVRLSSWRGSIPFAYSWAMTPFITVWVTFLARFSVASQLGVLLAKLHCDDSHSRSPSRMISHLTIISAIVNRKFKNVRINT